MSRRIYLKIKHCWSGDIWLLLQLINYPPYRHHHSADHDYAQHHCQEFLAPCVLCDCHGPLCDRVLLICLCCSDGVRHPQLLFKL